MSQKGVSHAQTVTQTAFRTGKIWWCTVRGDTSIVYCSVSPAIILKSPALHMLLYPHHAHTVYLHDGASSPTFSARTSWKATNLRKRMRLRRRQPPLLLPARVPRAWATSWTLWTGQPSSQAQPLQRQPPRTQQPASMISSAALAFSNQPSFLPPHPPTHPPRIQTPSPQCSMHLQHSPRQLCLSCPTLFPRRGGCRSAGCSCVKQDR